MRSLLLVAFTQTRNPCYHPGDIRVLQVVDVPGCRHLRDCIIFPVKGPRPHADEMAGGAYFLREKYCSHN